MKTILFYIIALMFACVACNDSENELFDNQGFPKTIEGNLMADIFTAGVGDGVEFVVYTKVMSYTITDAKSTIILINIP